MKTDLVAGAYIFNKENKILLVHHKDLNSWFPVGGHIEKNELPDDAVRREVKEETGLTIRILNYKKIGLKGNTKKELAIPVYVSVHSVITHDHCCFYYLCRTVRSDKVIINKESKDFGWFSQKDLNKNFIPADVRSQARAALKMLNQIEK